MTDEKPIAQIIGRIEKLNAGLAKFWGNAHGWAPIEAAELLSKSRLDWQVSLSTTLRIWIKKPPTILTNGELILAWVNLGSLIEGSLKLFLSVYYKDYMGDISNLKAAGVYDHKKASAIDPDGVGLDKLKKFFEKANLLNTNQLSLISLVQNRRNAVHAFQNKQIGDDAELTRAIRNYHILLSELNSQMPYPDDGYIPREF